MRPTGGDPAWEMFATVEALNNLSISYYWEHYSQTLVRAL